MAVPGGREKPYCAFSAPRLFPSPGLASRPG